MVENKIYPKFKYEQKVKIVNGFYKDRKGIIIKQNSYNSDEYWVQFNDGLFSTLAELINEDNLEAIYK